MNRLIWITLGLLAATGCEKEAPTSQGETVAAETNAAPPATNQATPEPAAAEAPKAPPFEIQVGAFDAEDLPTGLVVHGAVVDGVRFTDANGQHVAVLSKADDSQALHAVLAAVDDTGAAKELRRVKQLRGECEWDYSARFVEGALVATDVDKDGVGEVTVAYKFSCASDLSPSEYKVLVLEGEQKSILRGIEILMVEGESEPFGSGKFEAEGFENAPALMNHAERVWKANVLTRL